MSAQGLHARPAALFVQTISKHSANVVVESEGQRVNGKSIIGLLTLGLQEGTELTIEVDGNNAQEVMQEIEELFQRESL